MRGEFYKMDFEAWDEGTFDLTLEEEAAYLRLCHQMYRRQGPIPNSTRLLCAVFRCHHVKALALVKRLIAVGKIGLSHEGFLTNNRVATELQARDKLRATRQEAGHKGGTRSAQERSKPLLNNSTDKAIASTPGKQNQAEERRGDTPKAPKGAEPEGFPRWFAAYPPRDGANPRERAAQRYAAALKAGATDEQLYRAITAYRAELQRKGKIGTEFVKQAQFWLSLKDRLWDHYAPPAKRAEPTKAIDSDDYLATFSDERWRDEIRRWIGTGCTYWPLRNRTEPPSSPRTKVPLHILAEAGIQFGEARAA